MFATRPNLWILAGMLSGRTGIQDIKVDLQKKEGRVSFLRDKVSPEEIAEQIGDMGFDAYVKSVNGQAVKRKGTRVMFQTLISASAARLLNI